MVSISWFDYDFRNKRILRPYIEARTHLCPLFRFYDTIPIQVRRCVTMAQHFHNLVLSTEFLNQLCQRLLLFRSSGIGCLSVCIKSTNVADTDGMLVVANAAETLAVAVCPIYGKAASNLYRTVKPDNEIVPNRGKTTLKVHLCDFLLTDVLPGLCSRAMDYYRINLIHFFSSSFLFVSNKIWAANFAISSLFSIITDMVFSALRNSAFCQLFSLTDLNSQNTQ